MNDEPVRTKDRTSSPHPPSSPKSNTIVSWDDLGDYEAIKREATELLRSRGIEYKEAEYQPLDSATAEAIYQRVAKKIGLPLEVRPQKIAQGSRFVQSYQDEMRSQDRLINETLGTRVQIFDTTLRDGALDQIKKLSIESKLFVSQQLAWLGVDVIEVGDCETDLPAIGRISREIASLNRNPQWDFPALPTISATVKCHRDLSVVRKEIDKLWAAFANDNSAAIPAPHRRVHLYFPTSDELRQDRDFYPGKAKNREFLEHVRSVIRYARKVGFINIQVSAQDATRTEIEFLTEFFQIAIQNFDPSESRGEQLVLNVADTLGEASPRYIGWIFSKLREALRPRKNEVILGVHCHNDIGMGHACAFSAIEHGARHVEVTIAGIGPRVGNVALEEIVSALHAHDYLKLESGVRLHKLSNACRVILAVMGTGVFPNKPIIGPKAYVSQVDEYAVDNSHFPIDPESIGGGVQQIFSRPPSLAKLEEFLKERHLNVPRETTKSVLSAIEKILESKPYVSDVEILAVTSQLHREKAIDQIQTRPAWQLVELTAVSNTSSGANPSFARIQIARGKQTIIEMGIASGAISAAFQAISRATGMKIDIINYNVDVLGCGIADHSSVGIVLKDDQEPTNPAQGHVICCDIVQGSAEACLQAVNTLLERSYRRKFASSSPRAITKNPSLISDPNSNLEPHNSDSNPKILSFWGDNL